jgi:hypothetical protein
MDEPINPAELREKGIDPAILNIGQYFSMPSPGPVPKVDPANLRSVWELMQKAATLVPKTEQLPDSAQSDRSTVYDFRSLGLDVPANAGCSPGANVGAVWYRIQMLGMLQNISSLGSLSERIKLPDIDYGKPSDELFKALAVVPVMGIPQGGPPIEGLPVDVEELGRLVQKESGEPTQ